MAFAYDALATILLLGSALNLGSCFGQDPGRGHQRIYVEAWNAGEVCGSNTLAGCREAAINYLTTGPGSVYPNGYQAAEFNIMAAFGLLGDDNEAVDLTQFGFLKGKNYTQFGGVCRRPNQLPSAVSITLRPEYKVLGKDSGCLVAEQTASAGGSAAKPFAVALVKPPPPHNLGGGQVKGCPDGFCLVAVNAPIDAAITAGSDVVAKVCGEARHVCTIAVGDFNVSPRQTFDDRWAQLIGAGPSGPPKLYQTGVEHARIVTNLVTPGAMSIGQGLPLNPPYHNVTGMQQAELMDLLVPCQHPDTWANEGCKV